MLCGTIVLVAILAVIGAVIGTIRVDIIEMVRFTASEWVTFGIAAEIVIGVIVLGVFLIRKHKYPRPPRGRLC